MGRPEGQARATEVLARLAAAGLTTVRWFLFCDGRAGIRFDADGCPLGLDRFVRRDIDAALAAAAAHRLAVVPVLLDFAWCHRGRVVGGVRVGGHRSTIARADRRMMLLERVLAPVFEAYGPEPGIAAWDLFNEPEWVTWGYGAMRAGIPLLSPTMRGFLHDATAAAHALVSQPVTVGLASARGLPLARRIGLDLYQVHWYDELELRAPLADPPLADLDRPLLLGEFPTAGSALDVAELVRTARDCGYCGAFAWSATAADAFSDLAALERALARSRSAGT